MQLESGLRAKGLPMTHPQRFLQTILERPEDDSPRLHYARWLAGRGNPFGEFIYHQCVLEKPEDAEVPLAVHERRAQELLAEHHRYWTESLRGRVSWYSFRRGFVEEIALSDRQLIKHAGELFQYGPVRDIHLQSDGKRLDRLPYLPQVKHTIFLDLSSQNLGDVGVERLADAPMLSHVHGLNLGSTFMGDRGLEALCDSPRTSQVRELYLNDTLVTDEGVRQFLLSQLLEQLDVLDVRFTQITEEGIDVLRRILGRKLLCSAESVHPA
jgi:uncharacterized protein (TIGR02996 family)